VILLSMTATFGKLERQTLTLKPGLNILQAPNEWGKSTWCAFLVAMLYGIDTRQQTTKTTLADKEHYAPWSGAPMSGRMDILWNGRAITLERSSKPRAPFSQFRAYETASGTAVQELTAANCGVTLLGMEKEVFLRSAFLRLADLPLGSSEALRRRLNALVTTGDENGDGALLEQGLNKLKNEIFANRSKGLLPQVRCQLEEVNTQLRQLEGLNQRHEALLQRLLSLQQQLDALEARQTQREQQQEELLQAQNALQQLPPMPQLPTSPLPGCDDPAALLEKVQQRRDRLKARQPKRKPGSFVLLLILTLINAFIFFWFHPLASLAALIPIPIYIYTWLKYYTIQDSLDELAVFSEKVVARYCTDYEQALAKQKAWQTQYDTLKQKIAEAQQVMPPSVSQALSQNRQEQQQLQLQLGACQGQLAALGQTDQLLAQREDLLRRCRELETALRAVNLARETLSKATAQLQNRFAPRINKRAQALFSRLTDGRYDRLTLTDNLCVETATEQEDILRSPLWRSDGTADQLYLAVRLAVSGELAPHAPFILDDALVRFDDTRLRSALALLQEEAENRQILLFTCQSREATLAEGGKP